MRTSVQNILHIAKFVILHAIFWLVTFTIHRLLFIGINSSSAIEVPFSQLAQSLLQGTIFDLSIVGYLTLVYCAIYAIAFAFGKPGAVLKVCTIITGVVSTIIVVLLPANAIVYSYWGYHFDSSSLGMITDPATVMASVENWAIVLFAIAAIAIAGINIMLLKRLVWTTAETPSDASGVPNRIIVTATALLIAAAMIIPIRGGLGLAPLNSGRAFFCDSRFACHAAINPAWNFLYSLKRMKEYGTTYHFMDDSVAQQRFDKLMAESGNYPNLLNAPRPNVVVILLESFSAHGIKHLGGINATPTIDSLVAHSVTFTNIMAASDRSGKGLVATICGYPVLPTFSVIQYPKKTQTLPFLPRALRNAGYTSQTFIYGGDLNFNSFNSLVTLAGFDNIITQDDFDQSQMGDKWGAHDEHTLRRLIEVMDTQTEPFFNFIFTLSSHEPFTVPMPRKLDDDYLNSMYYTDKCLGEFFATARTKPWWSNTLFVLVADHGHRGPEKVPVTDRRMFNIPLMFTGGALATDTIVTKYGTQTDLAATLLAQLNIDDAGFTFSKNLLDESNKGFAFFDFNDGFGFADDSTYQVFDNQSNTFMRFESARQTPDSISGKAILQIMSNDNQKR